LTTSSGSIAEPTDIMPNIILGYLVNNSFFVNEKSCVIILELELVVGYRGVDY
jgi:hypothetical protein